MIYGVAEFSRYMQAYLTVQHAAREGARYAVTGQSITGIPDDRPASIVAKTRAAASGLRIAERSDTPAYEANANIPNDLDVWLTPEDAVDPDTRPRPFTPDPITVTVTYNFEPLFPVHFNIGGGQISIIPNLLTVVGQATMIVERIDRVTPVAEGTLPPTGTAGPSPTSGPTPTTGPTWTPGPTFTASALPTNTNTPTITATALCNLMVTSALQVSGSDKLRMSITNNAGVDAQIVNITITWPTNGNNKKIKDVKLNGTKIWDVGKLSSPTGISGGWKGSVSDRTIPGGGTYVVEIKFDRYDKNIAIDSMPYQVVVSFDVGCSVSSSIGSASTSTPTQIVTITNTPGFSVSGDAILVNGKKLQWNLTNSSSSTLTITSISINWPDTPASQTLKKAKLAGTTIWDKKDDAPPTTIASNWKGAVSDRQLPGSAGKQLQFDFEKDLSSTGYIITVTFDNGCSVTGSK